jgi:hypothetical protein
MSEVEHLGDVLPLRVLGLISLELICACKSAIQLRVSDSSALHCEIVSSGIRCSRYKPVVLVTLGGCHLLDGLVASSPS